MKRPASFSLKAAAGYPPRLRVLRRVGTAAAVVGLGCAAVNLGIYFDGHGSLAHALALPSLCIASSLLLRSACARLIRLFESFGATPSG